MELHTDRLILRPVLREDAVVYAALWSDPRVHPTLFEEGPIAAGNVPARVARHIQAWAAGTGATWTILHEGSVIGFVALHGLDQPVASVRSAIVPRAWRQGFAREALSAVLDAAPDLGVSSLEGRVHHDDEATAALLVGLGFVEGEPQAASEPPGRVFRWFGS